MLKVINKFFAAVLPTKTVAICYDAICTGELELHDIYACDGEKLRLLRNIVSVLRNSNDAYARALRKAADNIKAEPLSEADCYDYFLGNSHSLKKRGISLPYAVAKIDFSGYSVMYAACGCKFCGLLLFRDEILPMARGTVAKLRTLGLKTAVVCAPAKAVTVKKRLNPDEIKTAILKIEREKVLQEMKKDDKILVIGKACDLESVLYAAVALKMTEKARRINTACSLAGAFFSLWCLPAPWLSMLILANTSAFVLYNSLLLRRNAPRVTDMTEEESMFGKVNYTVKVGGMSCAHCSARVKSALESIRGVSASVSLEEKTARVKCPASLDASKISEVITAAGFTVTSVEKV